MCKKIIFVLIVLVVLSCNKTTNKTEFERFTNSINLLEVPVVFYDTLTLAIENKDNYSSIDSNDIKKYGLLDVFKDTLTARFPYIDIMSYKLKAIGRFTTSKQIVLVGKAFKQEMGNETPVIVMYVFDKNGNKLDNKIIMYNNGKNDKYTSRSKIIINDNYKINRTDSLKLTIYINKKIVPYRITKYNFLYEIDLSGKIIIAQYDSVCVWKNTNPRIR